MNWGTLNFGNAEIASFDAAERRGVTSDPIGVQLTATIGDLGRFLAIQRQGSAEKIRIEGTVTIGKRGYTVVPDKSFLQFFLSSGAGRTGGRRERFFRYRIVVCF